MNRKRIHFVKASLPISPLNKDLELDGNEVKTFYEDIVNTENEDSDRLTEATGEKKQTTLKKRSPRQRSQITATNQRRKLSRNNRQLLYYSQHGDLPSLRGLLSTGDVDVNHRDQYGWTALMASVAAGHIDCTRLLLSVEGVDVEARDKGGGSTARDLAMAHPHIAALFQAKATKHERVPPRQSVDSPPSPVPQPSSRMPSELNCDLCQEERVSESHRSSITHQMTALQRRNSSRRCHRHYALKRDNKGFEMMLRAGWDRDNGLGSREQGTCCPVKMRLKRDRRGVGVETGCKRVTHPDKEVMQTRKPDKVKRKTPPPSAEETRNKRKRTARRFRNEFNDNY